MGNINIIEFLGAPKRDSSFKKILVIGIWLDQTLKVSNFQNVQTFKLSTFQSLKVFKLSNFQSFKLSNFQSLKPFSNFKPSNFQTSLNEDISAWSDASTEAPGLKSGFRDIFVKR